MSQDCCVKNSGHNHLYVISFTVLKEAGLALVAAKNEKQAFQILQNSGSRNCHDGNHYTLVQIRDIGMTADCHYGLLMESFVNALEAYDAIINAMRGIKAVKGEKGDKGDKGDKGEKGDKGDNGEKGDDGDKGSDGKDGMSAYEIYKSLLPEGVTPLPESEWLMSLKGEDGEPGPAGPQGEQGPQGPPGPQGDPADVDNSDWNENDSSKQPFIKNRTHWEADGVVHKLDNKYIDSSDTPTIDDERPVTSDGVANALSQYAMNIDLTNVSNSKQDVLIETTVIPSTGMLPNTLYNHGTIGSGSTVFLMDTTDVDPDVINIYFWKFDTGPVAPTITWPNGLIWYGDSAPVILPGRHYEVSVQGGLAICIDAINS